jgi:ribosomal protein S18 acetylase RimI-like enzyme
LGFGDRNEIERHCPQKSQDGTVDEMTIRKAILSDAPAIGRLLTQLGYPVSEDFVRRKLALLLDDNNEDLLVGEGEDTKVIGFLAMHRIPQIGVEGGFARISYLCVDEQARGKGIGKALEGEACRLAAAKGCDRLELHCHSSRADAHRFYARRGYTESPKYFVKKL